MRSVVEKGKGRSTCGEASWYIHTHLIEGYIYTYTFR